MKKKMTISTFIISICIIVLSYYTYSKYLQPIFLANEKQTTHINLAHQEKIILKKSSQQDHIYSIEFEIIGTLDSEISILVCDSLEIPFQEIKLKQGEIDYIYKSDWYSNQCILHFKSKNKSVNQLTIEYRFLGLN